MINQIAPKVWKLNVDSNIYFLDFKEKTIIDAGPKQYRQIVEQELSKIINPDKITKVIFTHLHYDHIGNFDLFKNAKFYTSEEEITILKKNKLYTIGDPLLAAHFKVTLNPLKDTKELKIIKTPGHTKGSICIYYEKEKVLFSGDTLFQNGFGRTDFPFSDPGKMEESLESLQKIGYKTLAPGHDY
ncbi:MAG: MBL fold metallo-hydrolase, partial [Nanoarchaeota archaeon]|nr:MBL fold metallo-hydrolase [Nanoarchaeota archaeon]